MPHSRDHGLRSLATGCCHDKSKIQNPKSEHAPPRFTLMELLIVITIIAMIAGLALSGLVGAVNDARVARTRSKISKIDTLIMERYESYRTRSVREFRRDTSPRKLTRGCGSGTLRDFMRIGIARSGERCGGSAG